MGNCLVATANCLAVLQNEESSEDGRWSWLHNNMNALNATDLHT